MRFFCTLPSNRNGCCRYWCRGICRHRIVYIEDTKEGSRDHLERNQSVVLVQVWLNKSEVGRYWPEVTRSDGSDFRADTFHDPGALVTENDWKIGASGASAQEVQVRVTDTGRNYLNPHLFALGRSHLNRFHPHRIVNGPGNSRSTADHLR